MLYPQNFEHKIDFTSIRFILQEKCISALGKEKVDAIFFSSDFSLVMKWLSETAEMLRLMKSADEALPIGDFFDVRHGLSRVRVEGLFLDEREVFELRRALEAVRRMVDYIAKQDALLFPHLHDLLEGVNLFPDIIRQIDAILDKFGKIKDHATHELARIRREMLQVQSSVSRSLSKSYNRSILWASNTGAIQQE